MCEGYAVGVCVNRRNRNHQRTDCSRKVSRRVGTSKIAGEPRRIFFFVVQWWSTLLVGLRSRQQPYTSSPLGKGCGMINDKRNLPYVENIGRGIASAMDERFRDDARAVLVIPHVKPLAVHS